MIPDYCDFEANLVRNFSQCAQCCTVFGSTHQPTHAHTGTLTHTKTTPNVQGIFNSYYLNTDN